MNISEIRKKARLHKADALQCNAMNAEAEVDNASLIFPDSLSTSSNCTVAERNAQEKKFDSLPTVVSRDLSSGDQRLDHFFSWVPEDGGPLDKNYGTRFAELEQADTATRRWLTFSLGDEDYALDIISIREIIKPREVTEIPRVPDFLLGIISLRGTIIPIFDLKNRLRLGKALISSESRIIVCQDGDFMAGLLIDRITQVTTIADENIEPPPAIFSGVDRAMLDGIGRVNKKMLILLNLPSLLNIELNLL